jgi:hypothetical protein
VSSRPHGGPECHRARFTAREGWEVVRRVVEDGQTFAQAATWANVSKSTVHGSVTRWRQASAADRASLAWLAERSSRPHRSPTRLPADEERRICELWSAPAGARAGSPTSRDHPATLEGAPGAAADCVLAPPPAARTPGGGPLPVTVPGPAAAHEHREPGKFSEPGHAVTGDAYAGRGGSAGSTSTRSSTTAAGSATARSTTTTRPPPSSRSPAGRWTGCSTMASSPSG